MVTIRYKTAFLNKMDNEKLPYEIHQTHLHNLALNPNPGMNGVRVLKVVTFGIIGLILLDMVRT